MSYQRGFFVLFFAFVFTALLQAADAARYQWLSDLEEARELAAGVGKPMLIVFRCEP